MSKEIVMVTFHRRHQIWNVGETAGFPPHMIDSLVPAVAHRVGQPLPASVPEPPAPTPSTPAVPNTTTASLANVIKQG